MNVRGSSLSASLLLAWTGFLALALASSLCVAGEPADPGAGPGQAAPPAEKKDEGGASGEEKKQEPEAGTKGEEKTGPEAAPKGTEPAPLDAETARVVAILDAAHKKITSFRADYAQTRKVKLRRAPLKSSGTFYLRRSPDGKSLDVLFEEEKPFRSRVLFTETEVAFKDEETGEITRDDPRKGAVKPSEIWVMGRPSSEIRLHYDLKALPLEKGDEAYQAKLELVPRSEKIRRWVQRVVIWMRAGDGLGTKVRIVDKAGDYQEFAFDDSGLELNPELADELFKIE